MHRILDPGVILVTENLHGSKKEENSEVKVLTTIVLEFPWSRVRVVSFCHNMQAPPRQSLRPARNLSRTLILYRRYSALVIPSRLLKLNLHQVRLRLLTFESDLTRWEAQNWPLAPMARRNR